MDMAAGRTWIPGLRETRQKRAVATVLEQTEGFTSAQELHARLRSAGERVGLATVYNQLRALCDAGEIDSVRSESGEILYRRCGSPTHHHHLVCRRCGATVELAAPELETLARRLGEGHGYVELAHVLEVTGVCSHCAEGS
jgi:Fur family transcriptional regulator, ferric uptake regulator